MFGAMIGDIVGSKYEFNNIKTEDFPFFSKDCGFTDDTIMTVAVAKSMLISRDEHFELHKPHALYDIIVHEMQYYGRKYPNPKGAYGGRFSEWLQSKQPQPYNSYGNGSAMRVSPCGLIAVNLEEAQNLARISAMVTHNHPEGIKGAEAVASAIFLAKSGKSKQDIRNYIEQHYYSLDMTVEQLRKTYRFSESCQGSVPQAIVCFLESRDFEDAIRKVISIGGDCDTTGAICGSIAYVYYAIQRGYAAWRDHKLDDRTAKITEYACEYLPDEFIEIADDFHEMCWSRAETCFKTGSCTPVLTEADMKHLETLTVSDRQKGSQRSPEPAAGHPGQQAASAAVSQSGHAVSASERINAEAASAAAGQGHAVSASERINAEAADSATPASQARSAAPAQQAAAKLRRKSNTKMVFSPELKSCSNEMLLRFDWRLILDASADFIKKSDSEYALHSITSVTVGRGYIQDLSDKENALLLGFYLSRAVSSYYDCDAYVLMYSKAEVPVEVLLASRPVDRTADQEEKDTDATRMWHRE